MKNLTTKMMIAAAAFVAAAGVASAQTMEAKVPFAFRASGKIFEPGTYRVQLQNRGGSALFVIGNREPGDSVLAMAYGSEDPKKTWKTGDGVLSFQCGSGPCALRGVWMGDESMPVYRLSVPKLGRDEPNSVAEIAMHSAKSE